MSERDPRYDGSEIAVCGLAGRFPGAPDLETFWRHLCNGVESISFFTREELERAGEDPARLDDPQYVPARPVLDDVDLFDAAFFGFSPREAQVLDPQHRLFLECAWEALEHAGYDAGRLPGATGVYAGATFSHYLVNNLQRNRPLLDSFGDLEATIHNVPDSLATLLAYKLDLTGPCCSVQTFCSTSLVAVHMACQSLLGLECDTALAGGVTAYVPQTRGYLYREGSIVSPDGHCRVFDARAGGTVFGDGVGVVVLRRLEDALADGATVHAVIRGTAVNNDGASKASFAAPGVTGQAAVVVEALSAAGVDPASLGMVEAHGTGTLLGDPAEVAALTRAFRRQTARTGFCALGSVKTNVGHLDAAAGVTGLIKLVLSLEHGKIPPSLHFETPNPEIDFEGSPFFVNTTLRAWPRGETPRRGAVSAFGVGGTNAHAVLEEGPPAEAPSPSRRPQLLVLSARTETALEAARRRLAGHLEKDPAIALGPVAHTLQVGRRAFDHRSYVVAADAVSAVTALRAPAAGATGPVEGRTPRIRAALVFGDGSAWQGPALAAWGALLEEPPFRDALRRCTEGAGEPGARVRETLEARPSRVGDRDAERPPGDLAAVAVGHALLELWRAWGVGFDSIDGEGVGALLARVARGEMELTTAVARVLGAGTAGDAARADERAVAAGEPSPDPDAVVLEVGPLGVRLREGADVAAASPPVPPARAGLLEIAGRLWLRGVDLDGAALHPPEDRRRLPVPSYPFERRRHWVEPLEEDAAPPPTRDPATWLYRPVWRRAWPAAAGTRDAGPTLVFMDEEGVGAAVAERLRSTGADVTTVRVGERFGGDGPTGYVLDPTAPDDYRRLADALGRESRWPARILHLWSLEPVPPSRPDAESVRRAGERGFYSLLRLAAARPPGPLTVLLVTAGLGEVTGGEALAPERAPVVALARVLSQEEPDLRCAVVDVELPASPDVVDALVAELGRGDLEPLLALRRGRRWAQGFEPVPESRMSGPLPVRDQGVYLITGGLGDVGFALGAALARAARGVRLVLAGRRGLPPRERWVELLQADEKGRQDQTRRIRKVLGLESLGAEVLVQRADVTRIEDLRAVVRAARERFGLLSGVVHAAGELAADTFRPARELGPEVCERQFAPKVRGTLALARALEDEKPEFCVLTSSLSTVLGGAGYGAYAAANAFQDAYAAWQAREGRTAWRSLDFDLWDFPGRTASEAARRVLREGLALQPDEGLAVFERALRLPGLDRVVVSTAPLETRLAFLDLRERRPEPPAAGDVEDVEAALRAVGSVRSAAALRRPSGPGQTETVAFVAFERGPEPTVTELRRALRTSLPPERVPSSFVVLDEIPRGAGGAVDRDALSRLAGGGSNGEGGPAEPHTPTEQLIADLWKEALGVERVGTGDNFFDLGGHSLLSVRVLSRLEKETGVRLDPRDMIFQTLGQIAAACDGQGAGRAGAVESR